MDLLGPQVHGVKVGTRMIPQKEDLKNVCGSHVCLSAYNTWWDAPLCSQGAGVLQRCRAVKPFFSSRAASSVCSHITSLWGELDPQQYQSSHIFKMRELETLNFPFPPLILVIQINEFHSTESHRQTTHILVIFIQPHKPFLSFPPPCFTCLEGF